VRKVSRVKKRLPALLTRLEAADDERAPACHRALAGRSWDLAAARSAATGSPMADDAGESGRLRRLAQLVVPAETDVLQIADALRLAAAELDAVAGSAAGRARALGELWAVKRQAAGLSGSTLRSQVLCLTAYLDCGTASRAAYLLSALRPGLPLPPVRAGSHRGRTPRLARRDGPDRDADAGSRCGASQP
jgi:hypothetical protein